MEKYNRRKWLADTALLGSAALLFPVVGRAMMMPEDSGVIVLGANENPYGPSQKAITAIEKHLSSSNRYPFKEGRSLAQKLAERHQLKPDNILLGAGSSELLQLLGFWIVNKDYHLTYAFPAFYVLPNFVKRFKGKVTEIPLTVQQKYDFKALGQAIKQDPGVVYVVNPNNPTGTKLSKAELLDFCRKVSKHSYVIVDEAYIEYVGAEGSIVDQVKDDPKIIVLRTFSKIYGLAGLRVGYAVAHTETLLELRQLQAWAGSSINLSGIEAASASLDDPDFVQSSRARNRECLEFTDNALRQLGFKPVRSYTNFLYFEPSRYKGSFKETMKKHKILVSGLTIDGKEKVRVSMGTKREMEIFIETTKQILK